MSTQLVALTPLQPVVDGVQAADSAGTVSTRAAWKRAYTSPRLGVRSGDVGRCEGDHERTWQLRNSQVRSLARADTPVDISVQWVGCEFLSLFDTECCRRRASVRFLLSLSLSLSLEGVGERLSV